MTRRMRLALAAAAAVALTAGPPASAASAAPACVQVGVYEDDPATQLPALQRKAPGVRWLAVYLTAGRPLEARLVRLANARKVGLAVSWLPDDGRDGPAQPKHRLTAIAKGTYDRSLRALAAQLRRVKRGAVLRPMPEPNTPWYAWSGTVNQNKPADYVAAWKRVRRAVLAGGAGRVKLLWSPYAHSVPETPDNAIAAYFPGAAQVDLVGADAYNFGQTGDLEWTVPLDLFGEAYTTIQALAAKPFWIGETGSVTTGGDRAAWVAALGTLAPQLPKLAAIVWFDAQQADGDFRLRDASTLAAVKTLAKGTCA
jgi:mannan endo-1,4-beta-mannosidase